MVHFVEIPENLLGAHSYYPIENLIGQYEGALGLGITGHVCYEGEHFQGRVSAVDPDGQPVYFRLAEGKLPLNFYLDPETGEIGTGDGLTASLSHLPPDSFGFGFLYGDYTWNFVIEASDGASTIRQGFSILVKHRNLAPVWITNAGVICDELEETPVRFRVTALDPEYEDYNDANATLTYELIDGELPVPLANGIDGVIFNNGVFFGVLPKVDADQTYTIPIRVTDYPREYDPAFPNTPSSALSSTRTFTIHVRNKNEPPVWVTAEGALVDGDEGSPYSVQLAATDPQNDVLSYTLVSGTLPAGLTLSPTGLIEGTIQPSTPPAPPTQDWYTFNQSSPNSQPVPAGDHVFLLSDGTQVFRTLPGESLSITDKSQIQPVVGETYICRIVARKTVAPTNGVTSYIRPVFDGLTGQVGTPIFGNRSGLGYISDPTNVGYDFFDTAAWPLNQWITIQCSYTWPGNSSYDSLSSRIRYNRTAFPRDGGQHNYAADPSARVDGPPFSNGVFEFKSSTISASGSNSEFTVAVSDGEFSVERKFSIKSIAANLPPVWVTDSELGSFIAGQTGTFATVVATDPEGQVVSFAVTGGSLPPGITLSAGGTISGTATATTTTTYTFTISATDGETAVPREFHMTITVIPNGAPVWDTPAGSIGTYRGGDPFNYALQAHDPDSDPLTFALQSGILPQGVTLGADGVLFGTLPQTTVVSPNPTSLTPATQPTDNLVFDPWMIQGGGAWKSMGKWHPEGGPYIYISKDAGSMDVNEGTSIAESDKFAVYGNSPYTYQYTALAYNIQSGTFGVDIAWYDINDAFISTSAAIQDGNVGNPNVNPGTQVARSKTVQSPPNAAWGRARVYTYNLVWKGGSGGFAALVQNLMVSNTSSVQTFNNNATNGAPYKNPTYQYASTGSDQTFEFTATVSDGTVTLPRTFSMLVSSVAPLIKTVTANEDWTVPAGVTAVMFHWVIAGGGGGGNSTEGGNGSGGGGGGSGGYYHQVEVPCSPGQVFSFIIGDGGVGASAAASGLKGADGGGTTVLLNGTPVFNTSGGKGGQGGTDSLIPAGGDGGAPGGARGLDGVRGTNDFASTPGGSGAAGPLQGSSGGTAGPPAQGAASAGGDGVGFGSGGGGAGSHDRTTPKQRPGGSGRPGMVQFTYPSQGPTGGYP
jgi:hypothetical protein